MHPHLDKPPSVIRHAWGVGAGWADLDPPSNLWTAFSLFVSPHPFVDVASNVGRLIVIGPTTVTGQGICLRENPSNPGVIRGGVWELYVKLPSQGGGAWPEQLMNPESNHDLETFFRGSNDG